MSNNPTVPEGFIVPSTVIKPEVDTAEYKEIVLSNGLTAILSSNPKTSKSGAAVCVRVGACDEPSEILGLAHFLEHMLFMGTEKYPDEAEYSKYLADHAGYSNAYTTNDNTNYYFEVDNDAFLGALDRFAQFFICPKFDESCVKREMNAVHSEHTRSLSNEMWRSLQLSCECGNPAHNANRFFCGCMDTLDVKPKALGLDVVAEMKAFYKKHYSSDLMRLVIVSPLPLSQLEEEVGNLFSTVPRIEGLVKPFPTEMFPSVDLRSSEEITNGGVMLVRKPQDAYEKLNFSFPVILPTEVATQELFSYRKGLNLIGKVLASTKKGSLAAVLQKEGLCSRVRAYAMPWAFRNSFEVTVYLTEKGASDDGLARVAELVAAALAFLRVPGSISREFVRDQVGLQVKKFNSALPGDQVGGFACSLAACMHTVPSNLALLAHNDAPIFPAATEEELTQLYISSDDAIPERVIDVIMDSIPATIDLIGAKGVRLEFNSKRVEAAGDAACPLVEPIYDIKYGRGDDNKNTFHDLFTSIRAKLAVSLPLFGTAVTQEESAVLAAAEEIGFNKLEGNPFVNADFTLLHPAFDGKREAADPAFKLRELAEEGLDCHGRARIAFGEDQTFGKPNVSLQLKLHIDKFFSGFKITTEEGNEVALTPTELLFPNALTCLESQEEMTFRGLSVGLFIDVLHKAIQRDFGAAAKDAGFYCGVHSGDVRYNVIDILISGFSDKLPMVIEHLAEYLLTFRLDDEVLAETLGSIEDYGQSAKTELLADSGINQCRILKNQVAGGFNCTIELRDRLLNQASSDESKRFKNYPEGITVDSLRALFPEGFKSLFYPAFAAPTSDETEGYGFLSVVGYGNIKASKLAGLIDNLCDGMQLPASETPSESTYYRAPIVYAGRGRKAERYIVPNSNSNDKNDVIFAEYNLNRVPSTPFADEAALRDLVYSSLNCLKDLALVNTLNACLDQSFFETLRTKQNLAYALAAHARMTSCGPALTAIVETSKTDSLTTLGRIEEYLDSLFVDMDAEYASEADVPAVPPAFCRANFEVCRASALAKATAPPTENSTIMAGAKQAQQADCLDFPTIHESVHHGLIEAINALTYEEFREFVLTRLGQAGERRVTSAEVLKAEVDRLALLKVEPTPEELENVHSIYHPERQAKDEILRQRVLDTFKVGFDFRTLNAEDVSQAEKDYSTALLFAALHHAQPMEVNEEAAADCEQTATEQRNIFSTIGIKHFAFGREARSFMQEKEGAIKCCGARMCF